MEERRSHSQTEKTIQQATQAPQRAGCREKKGRKVGTHHHKVESIDSADRHWPTWVQDLAEAGNSAPERLWIAGNPEALTEGIATIGTRSPTPFGTSYAKAVAEAAAAAEIVIHSGWAKGCDIAGHLGAIEAGGRTCVWVSEGADRPGPSEHARWVDAVIDGGGAFVSEHPPGTSRTTLGLIARNRFIVGAATRGVHVCQTGGRGGTMGAVGWAVKLGRRIYVPYPGERKHPSNDGLRLLGETASGTEAERRARRRQLAQATYIAQRWYDDNPVATYIRDREEIAATFQS